MESEEINSRFIFPFFEYVCQTLREKYEIQFYFSPFSVKQTTTTRKRFMR